ncbi:MAG: polymerase factor sigma-32 [Candidatus Midichloriaceae bacterium]|jgi:RNA polymerase sigma-32 factor|nr:polymerase factor sigma-32 [Candidatus Midichloriaceae bacterium]
MSVSMLPVLSQETGLHKYLEEIKKFPILSEEEEFELAQRWCDTKDLSAAHILVTSHLRLVAKIAMQFRGYGLPIADIISEGNIGLMTAVKKFNPGLGHRLSTYAMWWIKATIQDYILKSWSLVKMGTSSAQKKLFFNLRKIKSRLLQANNGQVLANEVDVIAKELDVSKNDVVEMSSRFENYEDSLNVSNYGDDVEAIDLVVEPSDNQEVILLESDDYNYKKNKLNNALAKLNEREREVITERRLRDKPLKLEDLSKKFSVSSERIRQIEERAMQKLISYIANENENLN